MKCRYGSEGCQQVLPDGHVFTETISFGHLVGVADIEG
jgi:hypothetical protein